MNIQPEALRLAELLEQRGYSSLTMSVRLVDREIAAEMRRLNEVNHVLLNALNEAIAYIGIRDTVKIQELRKILAQAKGAA